MLILDSHGHCYRRWGYAAEITGFGKAADSYQVEGRKLGEAQHSYTKVNASCAENHVSVEIQGLRVLLNDLLLAFCALLSSLDLEIQGKLASMIMAMLMVLGEMLLASIMSIIIAVLVAIKITTLVELLLLLVLLLLLLLLLKFTMLIMLTMLTIGTSKQNLKMYCYSPEDCILGIHCPNRLWHK